MWHWRQYTVFGGDPLYYHLGARLLADGHGFINPYAYARDLNVQAADHPPLYLMYLSVFSLLGMGTITWHLLASHAARCRRRSSWPGWPDGRSSGPAPG